MRKRREGKQGDLDSEMTTLEEDDIEEDRGYRPGVFFEAASFFENTVPNTPPAYCCKCEPNGLIEILFAFSGDQSPYISLLLPADFCLLLRI